MSELLRLRSMPSMRKICVALSDGILLTSRRCAAMRRDHTEAEVSKRLETIETGIQDLSQSLRQRQDMGIPSSEATKNFEQFLRAANTFKSSASTVMNGDASTVKGGLESQYGGSIFGDSLSDDRYEIIQSWIPPPSPFSIRGSSNADRSNKQGGLGNRSSLPELMAVLETVTQMPDEYRNSEHERNSSKDEQLRSLEMENRALEQKLEKSLGNAEKQRQALEEREERLQRLTEENEHCNQNASRVLQELARQQKIVALATEEQNRLRQEFLGGNARLRDKEKDAFCKEKKLMRLSEAVSHQESTVNALKVDRQALKDTIANQAKQLMDESAERDMKNEALAQSRAENTRLNEVFLENEKINSKVDAENTKLKNMVSDLKEDNQYLQEDSRRYKDRAASLNDVVQGMRRRWKRQAVH